MKRLLLTLCVIGSLIPSTRAQDLSAADRKKAVQMLEKSRAGVLTATKGLSEAQWNFKPGPDRWSVAEVTEHIAATEEFLMKHVQDEVMKAPPRSDTEDVKAIDDLVLQRIPDRTHKATAPEPLRPTNRFGSPAASLQHFKESRARTITFVKSTKDIRQHASDSPLGKKLDAYEWVLFMGAHSERHTKQIEEVKADPNFPKQ